MSLELIPILSIDYSLDLITTDDQQNFRSTLGNYEMEYAARHILQICKDANAWVAILKEKIIKASDTRNHEDIIEPGLWLLEHYGWIMRIRIEDREYILPTRGLAKRIIEEQTGKPIPVNEAKGLFAFDM